MRCEQELFPNDVEGQTKQFLPYSLSVFSVFVPTSPIDFNTSGTIVWHQIQLSDIPIRFFFLRSLVVCHLLYIALLKCWVKFLLSDHVVSVSN